MGRWVFVKAVLRIVCSKKKYEWLLLLLLLSHHRLVFKINFSPFFLSCLHYSCHSLFSTAISYRKDFVVCDVGVWVCVCV